MAYTKQTWDDENPLYPTSETRLAYMEEGIETAQETADAASTAATAAAGANATYRQILNGLSAMPVDGASGTWIMRAGSSAGANGVNFGTATPLGIALVSSDYVLTGKTTKLRLRVQVAANTISLGTITFTFGLYPMIVGGGNDALTWSVGTVVSGSTAAVVNPPTSAITQITGSDFDFPSNGFYAIGVVTSAAIVNNAYVGLSAQLQQRWV